MVARRGHGRRGAGHRLDRARIGERCSRHPHECGQAGRSLCDQRLEMLHIERQQGGSSLRNRQDRSRGEGARHQPPFGSRRNAGLDARQSADDGVSRRRHLGSFLRQRQGAARESRGQGGRGSEDVSTRDIARPHANLRALAGFGGVGVRIDARARSQPQNLRPAAHRVPEHAIQAGRDGNRDCARTLVPQRDDPQVSCRESD
jgi:hypothetical protein